MSTWGEAQAIAHDAKLREQIARLSAFPRLGPARPELGPGSRAVVVGNYVVIYRIGSGPAGEELILVGRIVHSARQPTHFLEEGD